MTDASDGARCSLDGRVAATRAPILGDLGALDAGQVLAWDACTLRTGRTNHVGPA